MIIGSCGYGFTGSSVVTDLLGEYDGIQLYDSSEFTVAYMVDGLQDLEYHLMKTYAKSGSGDYAIKRFLKRAKMYKTPFINKPCDGDTFYKLSCDFIDRICQLKFRGVESADVMTGNVIRDVLAFASKKVLMPRVVEKVIGRQSYLWPCRTLYYCIEPENFYEECRRYINEIMMASGFDLNKPICLDQPFEGNKPQNSFPFYENPRAIVVDRDPRDLYFQHKSLNCDNKFSPKDSVENYVVYYRNMRCRQDDDPRVLRINFEHFVYEYDDSVKRVEEFLDLGEHLHLRPKTLFDPAKSVNNTQLQRLHPDETEAVKYIEAQLPEFLFPFENYPAPSFEGRPFSGAGRKIAYD